MLLSIGFYFFLAVASIMGFLIGAGASYAFFEARGKELMRKNMESRAGFPKGPPKVETRKEKRLAANSITVLIRSPKLDTAGVPLPDEFDQIEAELVDISKNGAAILTKRFLKKGLRVRIISELDEPRFKRDAEVRNIGVFSRGLRIGVQFEMPLTLSTLKKESSDS